MSTTNDAYLASGSSPWVGAFPVGITAHEAVESLKAAPQRTAVLRTLVGLELGWDQVLLAEHIGVKATFGEHLGNSRALERDAAIGIGKTNRPLGDAGYAISGMNVKSLIMGYEIAVS